MNHHHHGEHGGSEKSDSSSGVFWWLMAALLFFGGVMVFGSVGHRDKVELVQKLHKFEVTEAPVILDSQNDEYNEPASEPDTNPVSEAPAPQGNVSEPTPDAAPDTQFGRQRWLEQQKSSLASRPAKTSRHQRREAPGRRLYFPETFFLGTARGAG